MRRVFPAFLFCANLFCQTAEYTFHVVKQYPHDRDAFTQGLEFHDGILWESTGMNGRSSVRKVRLDDGRVLQKISVAQEHFGEGITVINGEIIELTWKSQVGFVYNAADLKTKRVFGYRGEGWGLTNNGREIFMSDGTDEIRVWDPKTLTEKRRIKVHDGTTPIKELNEIEWVEGEIFANVWQTDRIARISPLTGKVTGWIDLSGILSPILRGSADVLNGIAYDSQAKRLFVTGKLWPALFEIQLVKKNSK